MSRLNVCRLCLADDLPLRMIANTYLQQIFEKLTDVQLMTNNIKPVVVCYVCCIRLQHSYQLRLNSIQSEVLLDQIIKGMIPQNQQNIPKGRFGKALVAVISTSGEGWDDLNPEPGTPALDKNEMLKPRRTSEVPLESVLEINSDMSKISVDNIEIIDSDEYHRETNAIKKEMEEQTDIGVTETERSITDRLIIENIEEEIEIKEEPNIKENIIHPATQIIHTNNIPLKIMRADLKRSDEMLDRPPKKKPAVFTEPPKIIYYNRILPALISIQPWTSQIKTIPQNVPNTNYNSNLVVQDPIWLPSKEPRLSAEGTKVIFHQQTPQNSAQGGPDWQSPFPMYTQSIPEMQLTTSSSTDVKIQDCLTEIKQNGGTEKIQDGGAEIQDGEMESVLQSQFISPQVLEENKTSRTDGDIIIRPEEFKPEQPKNIRTIINNKYTSLVLNKKINAKKHKSNLVNKIKVIQTNDIKNPTAIAGEELRSTTQNETNDNLSRNIRSYTTETNEPENNFKCLVCEESFPKMGGLAVHIRKRHPKELPFGCNICKNRFSRSVELTIHSRTHIVDSCVKCDICRKTFNTMEIFQSHTCERQQDFKCHVCDKSLPRMRELVKHIKQDHPKVLPLECKTCKKRFAKRNELTQHMYGHNDPDLKCDTCNIAFISTASLRDHNKRLHDKQNDIEKPTSEAGVELGIATSDTHCLNDPNLKCDLCSMSFISTESLQDHNKSLHSNTNDIEKPTAEAVNEFTSTTSTSTTETGLTEPAIKFDCHVCKESFPRLGGLVVHIRKSHPKVLPFECFICKKRFAKNSGLIKHMRIHTDPEVFKCDKCSKTFNAKNKLQAHKRLHLEKHRRQ